MSFSSTGDITTRPRFEHLLWLIKVVSLTKSGSFIIDWLNLFYNLWSFDKHVKYSWNFRIDELVESPDEFNIHVVE